MVFRIMVKLDIAERNALAKLAEEELRSLPDQIRAILREELTRKGFIIPACMNDQQDQNSEE